MSSHNFNFVGGDELAKIGASWFASFWNYNNRNTNEISWKDCKTVKLRIKTYFASTIYHNFWRKQILKMNENKLSNNSLGLSGAVVKTLVK